MRRALMALVLLILLLGGCKVTPSPSPTPSPTPTPRPPTATPEPTPSPDSLVICATEPLAVSPFAPSEVGTDILALFMESPLERVSYGWEARLVEDVPTLENGAVITSVVEVRQGERYIAEDGSVQTHSSATPLEMTQLRVTFSLKSDLRWSNGESLTTQDFILGYHLAQSDEAYGQWPALVERTARFVALDDQSVQWEGIPGYLSTDYAGFLFPPQPAHRWKGKSLSFILEDRTPPATGPFKIVTWVSKSEVLLTRNPHYVGTPSKLSEIMVRFPQTSPDSWSRLLLSGECDLILPEPLLQTDPREWTDLANSADISIWADTTPVMLRLDLNVDSETDEPTALSDLSVRQGLSFCLNRGNLSNVLPGEALLPAYGFIPPGHPAYNTNDESRITYNVQEGAELLTSAGWRDEDGDGIREAHSVNGFSDGDPLSLTLHLAPQYFLTAAYIAADLETCGVGIRPLVTEQKLLYATDAASPLFGRTFEMVLFGWQSEIPQICGAWRSDRIPNADNAWIGENFSGFSSDAYDAACRRALLAVDPELQQVALREAESLLNAELPTLFLTWRPFWFVAHSKVQGLKPDSSALGTLWNAEELYIAP